MVAHEAGWGSAAAFELVYASGLARLMERSCGGVGIILKFERVRPERPDAFQPLRAYEITPRFLHRVIGKLKRWKFDIVDMDEACRRARLPRAGRRFVAMTFDGGTRDFVDFAYPVLSAHEVPFTLYLPTAIADGRGEMWPLALEAVIAQQDRISVMIDDNRRHFETVSVADKRHAYHYLDSWLRTLPLAALSSAINDLCIRYAVDLASLSRAVALSWDDVATFVSDPRATIGCATVHGAILANLDDVTAKREIAMGRAVARSALPYDARHFAYPFGGAAAFSARDVAMATGEGFTSAVTSVAGVVQGSDRSDRHALPRLAWDGRRRSLRALRVMLSGVMLGTGALR